MCETRPVGQTGHRNDGRPILGGRIGTGNIHARPAAFPGPRGGTPGRRRAVPPAPLASPVRAHLLDFWDTLRSSYWFIPSLMAVGAIVLSVVTTVADGRVGPDWIDGVSWLYANKPEGARTLLSTVAGSMIGVAGVTFSITIASVVYASGQYGPRLLSNFMRDTGNQVTLGTFIATFLYGLLVLRTIRTADEGSGGANPSGDLAGAFVPHIAILVGLVLALASIAVLIYFIHHVPDSIHVSNVIAGIGRELAARVDQTFPEPLARAQGAARAMHANGQADLPADFFDGATRVEAHGTGYVPSLDARALFDVAEAHGLVLRLRARPGDFVSEGEAFALVHGDADDDIRRQLRGSFVLGRSRTPLQDVRFLINELVEIAARALSPGVNDPFTAMSCLDWLGAALKKMAGRDFPSEARFSEDGTLRLVARPTTYADLVSGVFGQLRPYVSADRNAALHALKVIGEVAGPTESQAARAVLRREAEAIAASCEAAMPSALDCEEVKDRARVVAQVLGSRRYEAMAAEVPWLGGSA